MSQRLEDVVKFRDVQVAEDVAKMAELGWFDVEFTMYGCAYLKNDKMYYKVSPEVEDIYQFIEKSNLEGTYPSNVVSFTEKCPVPIGMKEFIAQDVKRKLAKKLKEVFPKEFFVQLNQLADRVTENSAREILWSEAEELEGVFEEEKLRYFEDLVNYTYSCRKITQAEYENLLSWLAEERRSMCDDFVTKDKFEKTLYGIAYTDNEKIKYVENARKAYMYEQQHALEQEGKFVTPIFSQTYWYNYKYRLPDVRRDFTKKLHEELNEAYIEKIKKIRGEKKDSLQPQINAVREAFGKKSAETLTRYAYRWNAL